MHKFLHPANLFDRPFLELFQFSQNPKHQLIHGFNQFSISTSLIPAVD